MGTVFLPAILLAVACRGSPVPPPAPPPHALPPTSTPPSSAPEKQAGAASIQAPICPAGPPMGVRFYDAGQALAVLVTLPDGRHLLVDTFWRSGTVLPQGQVDIDAEPRHRLDAP